MGRRAFIDQQPASRIGSGTPTGVCARSGHHRKKRQPIIHPGLLDRERIIASQPELLQRIATGVVGGERQAGEENSA
jgi:hypothetical protein